MCFLFCLAHPTNKFAVLHLLCLSSESSPARRYYRPTLLEKKRKKAVEEIIYNSFGSKQLNEQLVGDLSYIDKQDCGIT
jgi:hypothetical protein